MDKKIILSIKIIGVIIVILFVVLFVLSFSNVAVFDFQCVSSCHGCNVITPMTLKHSYLYGWVGYETCPSIWMDELGCAKDCKVRNFQCGYEFNQSCLDCINDCKVQYGITGNVTFGSALFEYGKCAGACYTPAPVMPLTG